MSHVRDDGRSDGVLRSSARAPRSKLGIATKTTVSPTVLEAAASGDVSLRPLGFGMVSSRPPRVSPAPPSPPPAPSQRPPQNRPVLPRTAPSLPRPPQAAGDRVEKGDAHFYELVVTPEQAAAGVVVRCASHGGSKFKLLKFEFDPGAGPPRSLQLALTEDCREDRFNRGTMAGFFFLGFDTADIAPVHPVRTQPPLLLLPLSSAHRFF